MKNTNRHWIIALGLAASLSLPGLAFADGWNRVPQKFAGQHYQQRFHNDAHVRDDHRHHEYARRDDDHHEWREHQHYRHFDRDDYRRHEWREHEWREHEWRRHADYYRYRVYRGAYWTGPFVPSSVGLLIHLR